MKNKLKGKYIVFIITFVLTVIGVYNYFSQPEQKREEVPNVAVNYKSVSNRFYYNSLDGNEKEAYEKIMQVLSTCKGGKIELEKPISHFNYSRVVQTIMYDGEGKYWPYVFGFPISADGKVMSTEVVDFDEEMHEKNITQIYVQLQEKTPREELKKFQVEFSKEGKLLNGEAFEKLLGNSDFDVAYYERITKEIDKIETEIINKMPRNISQEEAIQYFTEWIMKNMQYASGVYNDAVSKNNYTPVTEYLYELTKYGKAAYEQSILQKKLYAVDLQSFYQSYVTEWE